MKKIISKQQSMQWLQVMIGWNMLHYGWKYLLQRNGLNPMWLISMLRNMCFNISYEQRFKEMVERFIRRHQNTLFGSFEMFCIIVSNRFTKGYGELNDNIFFVLIRTCSDSCYSVSAAPVTINKYEILAFVCTFIIFYN